MIPRILFLVTEDWYFCSHRLPLAIAARQAGMKVTIVTRISDKQSLMEQHGLNVVPLDMERGSINPVTLLKKVLQVYRIFKNESPDLVHLVALKPMLIGGLAAYLSRVPSTVTAIAGMGFLFAGKKKPGLMRLIVIKMISMMANKGLIIVQNRDDEQLLAETGIQRDRIRLIKGAGVDITLFRPQPEETGLPIVMLASRLLWEKGIGEFVEAARQLKVEGVKARFVLVGEPDEENPGAVSEDDLRSWVEEGIIEWWGKKEDMPSVLSMAAMVCLPSYREGLPKVLLEAMACGKPCVTTDAPGCREAVIHGENGLLVPVRNSTKLAEAIKELLSDAELRKTMGVAARSRAEREFAQEIIVEQTMALYRELLNQRNINCE